ncbi:MAG: Na+/H+ antiporter NhaA [Desulfobulbaceae bacterium]|nr:Na+/H+ antiporter NhaA [Desulfobulbaceae bacterium]
MKKNDLLLPKNRIERVFKRIRTPLDEFVHDQASGALLLMFCAILGMVLANSGLSTLYYTVLHTKVALHLGDLQLSHTIHQWINDGLMALFFLVVGLEIKREILVGELSDLRQAVLPVTAAVGGMLMPALLFALFNWGGEGQSGWAIPMATDIAFAVGVMVLLGNRIPKTLLSFLLALAIVDDLGAVLIIALFYTSSIAWWALGWAGVFFGLLLLCNVVGIRSSLVYFLLGGGLWLMLLQSGVHATLAGVLTALTVPANSKCLPEMFIKQMKRLITRFKWAARSGKTIMEDDAQQSVVQGFETAIQAIQPPLEQLEHRLHHWVSFFIVPLFALANAGVAIDVSTLADSLMHPVTLGIVIGLVGGKFIGVFGSSWLLVKLGIARLPQDVSLAHIGGVGMLAGIGFTMAFFIGELAFVGQGNLLDNAKIGILAASLLSGLLGYTWLRLGCSRRPSSS